jgi:DNA polymerase III subunit beta
MKTVVDTKSLASSLGSMLAVVERTNVKPVLNNVLLEASQDCLFLSTTDSDLYVSKFIKSRVKSEGSTTVSARLLHDILRKMNDEEVELECSEDRMQVKGESCEFHLSSIPSNQFPKAEGFTPSFETKLPSSELAKILEGTVFSVSTESTRYNLSGVCLQVKAGGQTLNAVSTDCHRLSLASYNLPLVCSEGFEIILPKKTTEEFIKLAKSSLVGEAHISLNDKLVKLSSTNTTITSKLIDGKFPDYATLIPKNNSNKLLINSEYFADTIARVSTITLGAIEKLKTIQLNIKNGSMQISAHGNAYASARECIKFGSRFSYQGEEMVIGFNPRYLLDVMRALEKADAEVVFGGALSPVLIRPQEASSSCFIVMPIKVGNSAA